MTLASSEERDRVLAEIEIAHADAIAAGMNVLEQFAGSGEPFSANQCRQQLRAAGVRSASTGALFNASIKAGLIRRVGWETSTDVGTHAKAVLQYVGTGKRRDNVSPLRPATEPMGPLDEFGTSPLFEVGT